jgi:hypothetical protein
MVRLTEMQNRRKEAYAQAQKEAIRLVQVAEAEAKSTNRAMISSHLPPTGSSLFQVPKSPAS